MFRLTSCLTVLAVVIGVGHVSASTILPPPTHHYTFDADTQADDSAGTNHGFMVGGASIVADPQRGDVLDLDGVNDYVALQYSTLPDGQTDQTVFTIATWVKIPDDEILIHGGIYGEFSGPGFTKNFFRAREFVSFDQYDPKGGYIVGTTPINDGTWHHIAYVQNEPGSWKRQLYVDGVLDNVDMSPERYVGGAPTTWTVGARLSLSPERYTEARIDDLRFYNVALDADQIGALIPEPSSLVLLFMGAAGLLAYGWRRR